jgi:uncharacterized membrane protein
MLSYKEIIEVIGVMVEVAGVCVIVVGLVMATIGYARAAAQGRDGYAVCRQNLGRAILLGLEYLVAGDIIRTVAIDPTLESVTVLGLIILIRTFLSFSLEVELEGRWPWQAQERAQTNGKPLK